MKKLLLLGSGAREHALAWKLRQDGATVQVAPGNAGIPGSLPWLSATDFAAQRAYCEAQEISLLVVGPEAPLAAGVADFFAGSGIQVFGPSRQAAQLESSKIWSKEFMHRHGVATARAWAFRSDQLAAAQAKIAGLAGHVVVKYDGLAGGKGVYVCSAVAEAEAALQDLASQHGGGFSFLLEEKLSGLEISLMGLCDGTTVHLLASSQDHKQLQAGDQGPNTGGMGAYCPVPFCDEAVLAAVRRDIIDPTLAGLQHEQLGFQGFLYFGIMLTPDGPKLLEYNVRLGDPEAEVLLPALESSLLHLIEATLAGTLSQQRVRQRPGAFVGVVLASGGYPASNVATGFPIAVQAPLLPGTLAFWGGVRAGKQAGQLCTAGGRVGVVVAQGPDLAAAVERVYAEAEKVEFAGKYVRTDIGQRGLKRLPRLAVLLSGRGSNMLALVEATRRGVLRGVAEVAVVFSNDPAAPGLAAAAALGLPVASLASRGRARADFDAAAVALLHAYRPDYVVLAGYLRVLSPVFIAAFPGRILNIHPADTQQHQGLHAYEWAWENRLPATKITVHLVDKGLDTGPILAQQAVDLQGAASLAEVQRRGLLVEHDLYARTLAAFIQTQASSQPIGA